MRLITGKRENGVNDSTSQQQSSPNSFDEIATEVSNLSWETSADKPAVAMPMGASRGSSPVGFQREQVEPTQVGPAALEESSTTAAEHMGNFP